MSRRTHHADPMMRCSNRHQLPGSSLDDFPLFGTQHAAAAVAATSASCRRGRIMDLLSQFGELSLPEMCGLMNVTPNQISGRVSDLCRDGLIEPTGQVAINRATGCPCSIYRLRRP